MPWNCLCSSKSKNRRPEISAPILNVSVASFSFPYLLRTFPPLHLESEKDIEAEKNNEIMSILYGDNGTLIWIQLEIETVFG